MDWVVKNTQNQDLFQLPESRVVDDGADPGNHDITPSDPDDSSDGPDNHRANIASNFRSENFEEMRKSLEEICASIATSDEEINEELEEPCSQKVNNVNDVDTQVRPVRDQSQPDTTSKASSKKSRYGIFHKVSGSKQWISRLMKPDSDRGSYHGDGSETGTLSSRSSERFGIDINPFQREDFPIRMTIEEFVQRFRDISFSPNVSGGCSADACERILSDAGINGYAIAKGKVLLRHWHGPVLQEIATNKKQMIASADAPYGMDNGIVDLDDTTPVSTSNARRPALEAIVDIRSPTLSSKHGTMSSSTTSHTRVAEWMQQQGHVTSDVSIPVPVYNFTPPPLFSKKNSHVRIKMPGKEDSLLDMRLWDRFQMIPRERVSTSDTFRPFLRAFKIFCYVLFFCVVLGSAVVSKLCILLMASSILKDKKALRESDSPTNTMLVIAICFPYVIWMFSFSAKSLFGSNSWPSFKTVIITLFMELLHSFGLCLMVFHILPRTDMARGLLHFCGICTVPAFLKTITIATDKSRPTMKRFTLTFVNGLAFVIQLCNLAASTMFSNPLNETERNQLQREVIYEPDILHTIERPVPNFENRYVWEIPVALIFISITYWENFVESDLSICSFNIPFLQWKRRLISVRERLYIFVGIWKTGWTLLFAALLLPGFSFNIEFSTSGSNLHGSDIRPTTTAAQIALGLKVSSGPPTASPLPVGGRQNTIVKRAISDQIDLNGVSAVLNLTDANMKGRTPKFRPRPRPVTSTSPSTAKPTPRTNGSSVPTYNLLLPESVKRNFQRYGPLYLQLLCSAVLSYFGSLACKLCMQVIGFTIPLFMATPITLGIIIVQCYTHFIPSHLYIWLCPETSGEIRMFHLLWFGVLWVSHIILTSHIWFPRNGRMAKIDRLTATVEFIYRLKDIYCRTVLCLAFPKKLYTEKFFNFLK